MSFLPRSSALQYASAQWVLPISSPPIQNGFVAWLDGKIQAVGACAALPADLELPAPTPGSLLSPGLVNVHAHLEQSFAAPIVKKPGQPFSSWLYGVVEVLRAHASPPEKAQRCQRGVQELLTTGTTCVNDVASGGESLHALDTAGLRALVALEGFHPGHAALYIDDWVANYQHWAKAFQGHPRLQVGLSPHSPYNVSPLAWQAMREVCDPPFIHAHVAEFSDELNYVQGRESCLSALHQRILGRAFTPQQPAESPVAYLRQFHLLNERTLLAHAVHTSREDRQTLAEFGVAVAHCPRSNLALHGQTLRAADWVDPPVFMGLGTDGRLSTEDLDLRAEARLAMALHGWTAAQALEIMTRGGARCLRLEHLTGDLQAGKQADWVLWQAESSVMHSPEAALMAASTQVAQVWVDGQRCYQKEALHA